MLSTGFCADFQSLSRGRMARVRVCGLPGGGQEARFPIGDDFVGRLPTAPMSMRPIGEGKFVKEDKIVF